MRNQAAKPAGSFASSPATARMVPPAREVNPTSETTKVCSVQSYKPVFLPKAPVQANPSPATVTPVHSNRKTPFIPQAVKNPVSLPTEPAAQPTVQTKQQQKPNRSMRIAAYPVSTRPVAAPMPITPLKPVETAAPAVKPKEPVKHVRVLFPVDP